MLKYRETYGIIDAFSIPHTSAYSLILLQEMNLCYRYTPLYWKVACLSVNSGAISEEVSKTTDYGAIAKAIGNMPKGFILPPSINKAQLEFIPIAEDNKAMYSLTAINGIGKDVALNIINNRPYSNFMDFLQKCIATKQVPVSKGYMLIKGGCFDEFNKDRRELMMQYVMYVTETKDKLTTANIAKLLEYNLIPRDFEYEVTLYNYRKIVFSKKNAKDKNYFIVPSELVPYSEKVILDKVLDAFDYDDNANLCLNKNKFDKWYKQEIVRLTDWLDSEKAVESFNNYNRGLVWDKYCNGSIEKWSMDALSYYTDKHELDYIPLDRYFDIKNFNELSKEPVITEEKTWGKTTYKIYSLSTISGTVVHKDKAHSLITLNTQYGIVDVKMDKGRFAYYDRTVEDDPSWLAKGTKVVVVGYRRGENFILKTYKNSIYKHSIIKIDDCHNGEINFKLERSFNTDNEE